MPDNFTKETFDYLPDIDHSLLPDGAELGEDADQDPTSMAPELGTDGEQENGGAQSATEFIELEGEQIPLDQAREWLSKGKDATRKWQEAAELKREAEAQLQRVQWVQELENAWNAGPQGQRAVIESLSKMAGIDTVTNGQPTNMQHPTIDPQDLSDEGRVLFQENAALRQELQAMKNTVDRVIGTFEGYVNENKYMDQAQLTAQKLKEDFGAEVSAQELREIAKKTGVQDFEAAWLKENKDQIKKGMFQAGHQAGSRKKPNSPGGSTRTFNVNDPKLGPDKMAELLRAGYVPSE